MIGRLRLLLVVALLLLASKPMGAGAETFRVGYPSLATGFAAAWVTADKGIWKKHGLDVELIFLRGGSRTVSALIGGSVDYVADYIFDGNTLLVSEDGANLLARATPIAFSVSGKYWANNHAHILKFENMATQRFVEFCLESIKLDEYITGAAQPKLNQKALNSIPSPKGIDAQAKIVDCVELLSTETQRLESLYQQKLAALEALKKSFLHQASTGEL